MRALIESLLFEEEGSTLDFKEAQYKFDGASDEEKSELLKDILAFTNAWRRTDSYILVGVKEVKGGRSTIEGVSEHIDDAKLQQFVNSKTNRPIEFSYSATEFEGKQVAVIRIPPQTRPAFLLKAFGRLKAEVVYLRRGSSTAIARPDEIALMGSQMSSGAMSDLSVFLVDAGVNERFDRALSFDTVALNIPAESDFPEYGGGRDPFAPPILNNRNYYSDLAHYLKQQSELVGVRFLVMNTGNAIARDVKLMVTISRTPGAVYLREQDKLLRRPSTTFRPSVAARSMSERPDIIIDPFPDEWSVSVLLGNIQAGDKRRSQDALYIAAQESCELNLEVSIFADDLSQPLSDMLGLVFHVARKSCSVSQLIRFARDAR